MIALQPAVALDLACDLSYASLAERLEQVRVLLDTPATLMTPNAGRLRPVLTFFVRAPLLLPANGFIPTRAAYVACLERALGWQTGSVTELLKMRRALDEEITRRLENQTQPGPVTPPMR